MKAGERGFRSLTAQIVAYVAGISLLVLLASSVASYRAVFRILSAESQTYTLQQLRQVEHSVLTLTEDLRKAAVILQSDQRLLEFVAKGAADAVESVRIDVDLVRSLAEILGYYAFLDSVAVFTERGEHFFVASGYSPKGRDPDRSHPFYRSGSYVRAIQDPVRPVWSSGTLRTDFAPLGAGVGDAGRPLVSLAKGVTAQPSGQGAVVVMNVDEVQLSGLYARLLDQDDTWRVYIVTDTGRTIPQVAQAGGVVLPRLRALPAGEAGRDGAFRYTGVTGAMSVIHHPIERLSWHLVREIPLRHVSGDIVSLRRVVVATFAGSILVILALTSLWVRRIVRPLHDLAAAMGDVGGGNLGRTVSREPPNEIGLLIRRFNSMSESILTLVERNREIEDEKRVQEIRSLQAQINPHFLYNTLNTIKYMALVSKADNVAHSLTVLGSLLRPVFSETGTTHSLREEIAFLASYIEIFNIRYGNDVSFQAEVPEDLLETSLPRFILQPLVENSLVHGFRETGCPGVIRLGARIHEGRVVLTLSDTGRGIEPDALRALNTRLSSGAAQADAPGVGVGNVSRRLELTFGEGYGLHLESVPGRGTEAVVTVPASR